MTAPAKPRCTLAQFIPNEMNVDEVKREGWQDHGILVVSPSDWRLRSIERQVIEAIGTRLFGRRKTR